MTGSDHVEAWLLDLRQRLVRAPIEGLRSSDPGGLFHGLYGRQTASPLVGSALPAYLLGYRLGLERGSLDGPTGYTGYVVAGGGTFTVVGLRAGGSESAVAVMTTRSLPYGFVGIGAEVRLRRAVSLGAEADLGRLATFGDDRASPSGSVVGAAALALRVAY